jgi:hypothetical protein
MTPRLVSLDIARPHVAAPARCEYCKHSWVAVAPAGRNGEGPQALECPACHRLSDAAHYAQVHNAMEVIDSLREAVLSGQVVAFAAVGIEPNDTTRMWATSTQPVSRLRVVGAIAHLGHMYSHGEDLE